MILSVFTDGGSKGNPGPASIGYVMYLNGKEVYKGRDDIGIATNNDAEYRALIEALKVIVAKKEGLGKFSSIKVSSDSRLLVNQVTGHFKIKNARIREYILQIRMLENEIGVPISYKDIPREENSVADALVNDKY